MERRSLISKDPRPPDGTERRAGSIPVLAVALLLLAFHPAAGAEVRADCRIDAGPCTATRGNVTAVLDIAPKPVRTMRELTFTVTLKDRNIPPEDATVLVDLTMPGMVMGRNSVLLRRRADGRYEGQGVIVRCPTGGKIWQATIEMRGTGRVAKIPFLFEVR